jgi:hypothetical protein
MAEGLLDGVLGGEEEKIDPTKAGAEPMVAAVAANLSNQSPQVAAETVAMFHKQTEVLQVQKKNLEAEYDKYDAALKYAPNWAALKAVRDVSARR